MIFSKKSNNPELEHELRSVRTIARGIIDFAQARQDKKEEFKQALDAIEKKLTEILKKLSEGDDEK
jgi:DNA topoisomerase VI subunit B